LSDSTLRLSYWRLGLSFSGLTRSRDSLLFRQRYDEMTFDAPGCHRVIIIDDDEGTIRTLAAAFRLRNWDVSAASSESAAFERLRDHCFHFGVVDLRLDRDCESWSVVEEAAHQCDRFVLASGYLSVSATVRAMKLGAADVLEKPRKPRDHTTHSERQQEHSEPMQYDFCFACFRRYGQVVLGKLHRPRLCQYISNARRTTRDRNRQGTPSQATRDHQVERAF